MVKSEAYTVFYRKIRFRLRYRYVRYEDEWGRILWRPPPESLRAFLRGEEATSSGFMLKEVLQFDETEWDLHHDFIQWQFPTTKPSSFNRTAPVLTPKLAQELQADESVQHWLGQSLKHATRHLGVPLSQDHQNPSQLDPLKLINGHRQLRISRILRSLTELGRQDLSRHLFGVVRYTPGVSPFVLKVWRECLEPSSGSR